MTDIETRLWATAAQTMQDAGMEFTVPSSRNVRDLVRAGVSVMRRENRLAESDLEAADASLGRLAQEMIRATREMGEETAPGRRVPVRETALVSAKRLCPLWPFG
jgi:hypothetical protein